MTPLSYGNAVRETTDVAARGSRAMTGTVLGSHNPPNYDYSLRLVRWSNGVTSWHKAERLVRT